MENCYTFVLRLFAFCRVYSQENIKNIVFAIRHTHNREPGKTLQSDSGFLYLTPVSLFKGRKSHPYKQISATGGCYHGTTLVLRNETDNWGVYASISRFQALSHTR